jgi:HD-GYP domain-containing protein (c-di-GMP phosphodiesterase class II)
MRHGERVAVLCAHYADAAGLSSDDWNTLVAAAYLHDIGKVMIPQRVLYKPGLLTEVERRTMNLHVELGKCVLVPHASLARVALIVGQHHERYDGTGYPYNLKGLQINPLARALSVVDAFCAMAEDRPYSPPMPIDTVLRELQAKSGTQFDPHAVEVFVDLDLREFALSKHAS